MSGWDWLFAGLAGVLLVMGFADVLGPFRLQDAERPTGATRSELIRVWCTGWLRRPREPLQFSDWMPHAGRMFLPGVVVFVLVVVGSQFLFGGDQALRWGGALVVLAGILVLLIMVGYVLRPTDDSAPVAGLFPTAQPGYSVEQVERAFAELPAMSRADIQGLRFRSAVLGYDCDAVDRALDEAATSRSA